MLAYPSFPYLVLTTFFLSIQPPSPSCLNNTVYIHGIVTIMEEGMEERENILVPQIVNWKARFPRMMLGQVKRKTQNQEDFSFVVNYCWCLPQQNKWIVHEGTHTELHTIFNNGFRAVSIAGCVILAHPDSVVVPSSSGARELPTSSSTALASGQTCGWTNTRLRHSPCHYIHQVPPTLHQHLKRIPNRTPWRLRTVGKTNSSHNLVDVDSP